MHEKIQNDEKGMKKNIYEMKEMKTTNRWKRNEIKRNTQHFAHERQFIEFTDLFYCCAVR